MNNVKIQHSDFFSSGADFIFRGRVHFSSGVYAQRPNTPLTAFKLGQRLGINSIRH